MGIDIAGSIRVPSVCNGIYGFRLCVGLIPHGGVRDLTVPVTDGVRSTVGPMATSIRDCSLFPNTVMQTGTWKYDSTVRSIPWTNLQVKDPLRIGVVEDDGVYTPSPPVRCGLKKAVELLRKSKDVELIPINLPHVKAHYQDLLRYLSLSGNDVGSKDPSFTSHRLTSSAIALPRTACPNRGARGAISENDRTPVHDWNHPQGLFRPQRPPSRSCRYTSSPVRRQQDRCNSDAHSSSHGSASGRLVDSELYRLVELS